jgi:hypothetical protein
VAKAYTTIRIDKDILENVKIYSEVEGQTQTDFINNMMKEGFKQYFAKRSGGLVMVIPNPGFLVEDSNKDMGDNINILADAIHKMGETSLRPIIFNLLAFYSQRLFYELNEDVDAYKINRKIDGESRLYE